MTELKCPYCGQIFTVDENELDSIVNQIRDSEFKQDVNAKVTEAIEHLKKEHQLELDSKDKEMRLELQMKEADTAAKFKDIADKEIRDLEGKLRGAEEERDRLKMEIENIHSRNEAEVLKAVQGEKEKVASLESDKKLLELAVKNEEEKGKTKVLEVKFGTPKPILFRECFEMNGFYCDLDLAARFAGRCEVLEYDGTRYEDEKAVDAAIKTNATQIIEKCYITERKTSRRCEELT